MLRNALLEELYKVSSDAWCVVKRNLGNTDSENNAAQRSTCQHRPPNPQYILSATPGVWYCVVAAAHAAILVHLQVTSPAHQRQARLPEPIVLHVCCMNVTNICTAAAVALPRSRAHRG
jgi:hypothetical protein